MTDLTTLATIDSFRLPTLPPLVVWAMLTGTGCTVLIGTGVVAFWLDRRSRRAVRLALATEDAAEAANNPPPLTAEEASRELTTVREAAARAATVAAHARHDSDQAAKALEEAERGYSAARKAHQTALREARPSPTLRIPAQPAPADDVTDSADSDTVSTEREVARAALGAYRRGDLSVEDLRRVWYGASGWNASDDATEQELLRLGVEELAARQEYHRALTAAQTARRAEYLADTAARALAAEAMAAAEELGRARRMPAQRSSGSRGRRP